MVGTAQTRKRRGEDGPATRQSTTDPRRRHMTRDRHPQIKVVLNGHAHQEFDQIYETPHNSVRCLVTPSTCVQFQPKNHKFQIDSQSAGFRHLRLYPNGTMDTKIYRLKVGSFQPNLAAVGY